MVGRVPSLDYCGTEPSARVEAEQMSREVHRRKIIEVERVDGKRFFRVTLPVGPISEVKDDPKERYLHGTFLISEKSVGFFFSKKTEPLRCPFCDSMVPLQSRSCECGAVYEVVDPPAEVAEDQRVVHNFDVGLGRVVGTLHQRAGETLPESGLMDVRFSKGED